MTSDWKQLPNAPYIIRILESVKVDPSIWVAEWNQEWDDAWDNLVDTSRRKYTNIMIWDDLEACDSHHHRRALYAARGAIMALIADDNCAYMLDSDPEELAIIAKLGDPRAILLLPACIRFKREL